MTFPPRNWRKSVLIQILRPLSFFWESHLHIIDMIMSPVLVAPQPWASPDCSWTLSIKPSNHFSSYQWNAVSRAMDFFPHFEMGNINYWYRYLFNCFLSIENSAFMLGARRISLSVWRRPLFNQILEKQKQTFFAHQMKKKQTSLQLFS